MVEIWKKIKNENYLLVSNMGNVKRSPYVKTSFINYPTGVKKVEVLMKEKYCKQQLSKKGYYMIRLPGPNRNKLETVHRLVAKAFLDNPCDYAEVNHIDGIKNNNNVNNLEWCSRNQNVHHALKNGLKPTKVNPKLHKRIMGMYNLDGIPQYIIAQKTGLSRATISQLINRKSWFYI